MFSLPRSVQQLIIRKLDLRSFLNLRQTCQHFRNARPGLIDLNCGKICGEILKKIALEYKIDELIFDDEGNYYTCNRKHYVSDLMSLLESCSKSITIKNYNIYKYRFYENKYTTHLTLIRNNDNDSMVNMRVTYKNLLYLCLRNIPQLYVIKDLSLQELDISGECAIRGIAINSPLSRSLRILHITGNKFIKKIDHLYLTTLYCDHSQQCLIKKYIPNVVLENN